MYMDPPDDAITATIGHGNEVARMNNDGGEAAGEELNEDGGEASGYDASLPKPTPKRIYNTVEFMKRKRRLIRH